LLELKQLNLYYTIAKGDQSLKTRSKRYADSKRPPPPCSTPREEKKTKTKTKQGIAVN